MQPNTHKTTYQTINHQTTYTHTKKKSKFIAQTHKIQTNQQIKQILKTLKTKHPKSNHIPYAFRLGKQNIEIGFSDDGEPTGSAGKPIYFELKGKHITNTLITVVRYFGGIKLGIGGLTKAFSKSAKQVLQQTQIIEKPITQTKTIQFNYKNLKQIKQLCKNNNIQITEKNFKQNCQFQLEIPIQNIKKIEKEIQKNLN